jgi:glycosyltransferase involved in cell wall biosynthesis
MPKILYFASEDWWFLSHFRPMAEAARACGFDVVVATRVRAHGKELAAEGYKVIALEAERSSLDPFATLKSVARMIRIIRAERPAVVHCIALRMVLLGGLAAWAARQPRVVLAPTGLGYLWIQRGALVAVLRVTTRIVVAWLLRRRGTVSVFENTDDPREFRLDPYGANVVLVGGAGVDPAAFASAPEPAAPPVKVAVVARMIRPKGIAEAVAATRRARELGAPVELHLYGKPDASNRTSCSEAELRTWAAEPGIHWHGPDYDSARIYREHHIAMLLSAREGLPKTLVEAAAVGRPIVASDVVGSREVLRHGREGFLTPPGDIEAAARALVALAGDATLRARLGRAANARFHERFTVAAVTGVMARLYRDLLSQHLV